MSEIPDELRRIADDWHNGPKSALYQFAREAGAFAENKRPPLPRWRDLRFEAWCADSTCRNPTEKERLAKLQAFADARINELRAIRALEKAAKRAKVVGLDRDAAAAIIRKAWQ